MKILLATDGSEHSEGAARFLKKFSLSSTDEIFILHAISWTPILTEWEYIYDDLRSVKEEVAPQILEVTAKAFEDTNVKLTSLTTDDYPDRAILTKAKELDTDLIVMGARGLSGFGSKIVGSTTKTVAIKSEKPVLIIRPPQQELQDKMKILFPTDGSTHSDDMCTTLSRMPFPDNADLVILNVLPTAYLDIPDRFSLEIDSKMRKIVADIKEKESKVADEILDKTKARLESIFSTVDKLVKSGDPPMQILKVAEEKGVDIIAIASSGMRGITGMIGSVSRYVLNHSTCSMLIGKTGQ